MSMSKRDYEAIAGIIRDQRRGLIPGDRADLLLAVTGETALLLADLMAADNPRFDRSRFLAACRGEKWTAKRDGKSRNSWQTGETHGQVTDPSFGGTRKAAR